MSEPLGAGNSREYDILGIKMFDSAELRVHTAPHLVVVGHSPMARTLAELSRALGWRTDLIAGQDFTAADVGERSIVVVATQGHHDEEAITQAIAASPAYVGLVGSARRGAAVLGYLAERGLPRRELDKVRVPAGLDLGPTTHQEIAVAILAELVKLRASGALTACPGALASVRGLAPAVPVAAPARVSIRMGPVRLRFAGTADIAERDDEAKRIVVNAAGADERGRGQAAMTVTARLTRSRTGTKVGVSQDLQISGAAAQYGRGMISDVTSVLMRDFAANLQDGIARLDRGESLDARAPATAEASGLMVGLQAMLMALRRVFRRFFVPYQAPNPS